MQRLELTLVDPGSVGSAPVHRALGSVILGLPASSPSPACAPIGPVFLEVPSDSIAYAAGLRTGDYLTSINGEAAISATQIQDLLDASDGRISFDILRAGTAYRIEAE
ncbi:PDZ domain-containing protein [Ensifer adhaerens]|uniref:PDZ domain-containing protein n=1 Tax=Ensifer adhaerens TaxID=106592 RepID=UPI0039C9EB19